MTFLNHDSEKKRYLLHQNDINDVRYQKFVNPIVQSVLERYSPNATSLDFGAGTAPVIASLLSKKGYSINLYDPYFHPDNAALELKYDFIICCEVVEHFHSPLKEFQLLQQMLKPGGSVFCMTELLPEKGEFNDWYYKNDPTHVIFYSHKTLEWIKVNLGFSNLEVDKRLFILSK